MKKSGQWLIARAQPRLKKKSNGTNTPDIERLIFHRVLIEGPVRFVSGFAQTCSNQAHVTDEKQPDESGVGSAPAEPGQRTVEPGEENCFPQGAGDVKKVVTKLERPFDESEGVNDRT